MNYYDRSPVQSPFQTGTSSGFRHNIPPNYTSGTYVGPEIPQGSTYQFDQNTPTRARRATRSSGVPYPLRHEQPATTGIYRSTNDQTFSTNTNTGRPIGVYYSSNEQSIAGPSYQSTAGIPRQQPPFITRPSDFRQPTLHGQYPSPSQSHQYAGDSPQYLDTIPAQATTSSHQIPAPLGSPSRSEDSFWEDVIEPQYPGSGATSQPSLGGTRTDNWANPLATAPTYSAPAHEASPFNPGPLSGAGRIETSTQAYPVRLANGGIYPMPSIHPAQPSNAGGLNPEAGSTIYGSVPAPTNITAPIPRPWEYFLPNESIQAGIEDGYLEAISNSGSGSIAPNPAEGSNSRTRDQERPNPAARPPPSRESHGGNAAPLLASSSRVATSGGEASSGIQPDLRSQAPQTMRSSNTRRLVQNAPAPAPSSSDDQRQRMVNQSQHPANHATHPAAPQTASTPAHAPSPGTGATDPNTSDTLLHQPLADPETSRAAVPNAPAPQSNTTGAIPIPHAGATGQESGSSQHVPDIPTVPNSSVRTHSRSSSVNTIRQAFSEPSPPTRRSRPDVYIWSIPEAWKSASDLIIENSISAEMFLKILRECVNLQKLSVVLDRRDSRGILKDSHSVQADKLEILSITTSVEPRPILDALVLPKLRTFRLAWDSCHGQSSPRHSKIGFSALMDRSFCPLKSLSLSNVFPAETELLMCLELPHVGSTLQKLVVRGDVTDSIPSLSSGRLITGDTLNALLRISPNGRALYPDLRSLELSYCYPSDGQVRRLLELRGSGRGYPFDIALPFQTIGMLDVETIGERLSVRMKGVQLRVTAD